MLNNDWSNLGNSIRDIVQDAIDSQDFNKLNETINSTIKDTVKTVESSIKSAGKTAEQSLKDNIKEYKTSCKSPSYSKKTKKAAANSPKLFKRPKGTWAGGLTLTIIGGIFSTGLCIALLILLILLFFTGLTALPVFILSPLFLASLIMLISGIRMLRSTKRFDFYIQRLNGKTYFQVEDFAKDLNKSNNFVKKDLKKMIERQWFTQGHLDENETCLMVSNESYEQYLMACEGEKNRRLRELDLQDRLTPQAQEIIAQGQVYIAKIRKSNDAILGNEISSKIAYLETVVSKIFQRVEQHPESAQDLRKLMDYYLPTTVKLLDAYEQLDSQPIQGANILNSKTEIESTLDTLNLAFEKLLDGLFKDTAWDVSSDISVLRTILAQEGLTKNDFRKEE